MQLFSNNADSILDGAIGSATTTITLRAGDGAKFPAAGGGDFFLLTLFQKLGSSEMNHEIVLCTDRTGDVLTVVRAQEGTTAKDFNSGDSVELRLTAGTLYNKEAAISAGTAEQYWKGNKSWGDFVADVRAAVLTGLSTASSAAVVAADTLLQAIGKLQAQVALRATIASPSFTSVATFQGVRETVVTASAAASYTVVNTASSIAILTLTANTAFTFPAASAGEQFTLLLTQDATGSRVPTWPASVRWAGGTAPLLTTTAAKTDVLTFLSDGTYWLGFQGGLNFTRA